MIALAFVALFIWPIVIIQMFRRMPVERALIWSLLAGYMFLPPVVELDLPLLPALDKTTIPNLTAFLCLIMMGRRVPFLLPNPVVRVLLVLFVVAPIGTVLTNQEPILLGSGGFLPGLQMRDAISMVINQGLFILPFFMGRAILRTDAALKELVRALFIGGLIYSIPMLIEIRLSPQFNTWIYGFFQHSFDQMMRWGGFRPIVFMTHALWVALFTLTALLCTLSLARFSGTDERPRYVAAALYLLVVLALSKSVGVLIYLIAFGPILILATRKLLVAVAASVAMVVLLYPILRGAGFVPVDQLIEQFARISPDRAQSLGFRLFNEGWLLEHALEKPFFGWGGWDRNLVHDPITGEVATVSDGQWVIVIGILGWGGYIVQFGLLTLPLVLLYLKSRRMKNAQISPWLATLALLHSINLLDLIPNATLIPLTWLACGALFAHVESDVRAQASDDLPAPTHGRRRTLI